MQGFTLKSYSFILYSIVLYWAIPEKTQTGGGGGGGGGGLRIWNFQWYQRNSMWNFQGLIKNKVEFPRVTKKK